MIVLGIETSCDETAVALVQDDHVVLSEIVLSQEEHRLFGGVVPEISARAHLQHVNKLIFSCLKNAGLSFTDIDAVAATGGPGLIGGIVVGTMTAKAISAVYNIPFIAVNHLEGHALIPRLTHKLIFPYLLLLISGGHCQLLVVENVGCYYCLGTTIDDTAGEAFDKVAKMLGLGYPGGSALEWIARNGNTKKFILPKPMYGREGYNFSFSGLKTAVRQIVSTFSNLTPQTIADLAASFQLAIADILIERTRKAIARFRASWPVGRTLVVTGGVAANSFIRTQLSTLTQATNTEFIAPPTQLCTDNATMIAWVGLEHLQLGLYSTLTFKPYSRWHLDSDYFD